MFKWYHESSIEVDLPLHKTWDFYMNPSNWPKWEDRFDSCTLDGPLRAGAKIRATVKNKPTQVAILITEVTPYQECKTLLKIPFFTQEALYIFQEISPEKTRILLKICVISFLAPFMKSFFLKNIEKVHSKSLVLLNKNSWNNF